MKPKKAKKIVIGTQSVFSDSAYESQFLREIKYEILKIGKITAKGDRFRHPKFGSFRIYDTTPKGEVEVTYDTEFEHVTCCSLCDYSCKSMESLSKHMKNIHGK